MPKRRSIEWELYDQDRPSKDSGRGMTVCWSVDFDSGFVGDANRVNLIWNPTKQHWMVI